jgi:hypothetical protein
MINVQRVLRLYFHLGDQVDSHSDSLQVDKRGGETSAKNQIMQMLNR